MSYIKNYLDELVKYCEKEDFRGWDPYDALNSVFFQSSPFRHFKITRIIWTQLFKNSPFNLRNILAVAKEYNPKALALFISSYVNLYRALNAAEYKEKISYLIKKLLTLQSKGYSGYCWGYNFDWQSRTFFIPKFTPNVIVSTFVGNAFLDVYEITKDKTFLEIPRSICDFILKDLNRNYEDNFFSFSYSPKDKSKIFNASLLASKLLARVYCFTKEDILKDEAKESVELCVKYQNHDGGWFYGLDNNQKWIDSFHTAYNLEAIYAYRLYTQDNNYSEQLERGTHYYLRKFFTEEGIPKFYADQIFPIDIHSSASLAVFLAKTGLFRKHLSLLDRVLFWSFNNMQDKQGYFYYQINRYYKIKIPYIRWACAWMFYALSSYLYSEKALSN